MATLARAYPHTFYDASIIRSCCDTYDRNFHRFYKSACQIWKRVGRGVVVPGGNWVIGELSHLLCVGYLVRWGVKWLRRRSLRFAWRASPTQYADGSLFCYLNQSGNYRNGIYNSAGGSLTFPEGSLKFPKLPPENKPGGWTRGGAGGLGQCH